MTLRASSRLSAWMNSHITCLSYSDGAMPTPLRCPADAQHQRTVQRQPAWATPAALTRIQPGMPMLAAGYRRRVSVSFWV